MFTKPAWLGSVALLLLLFLAAQARATADGCDGGAFDKVTSLLQQKLYDQAAASLDRLRSCSNLSPLETFQLGWLYGRARHFHAALDVFSKVPGNVPDPATHNYAVALSKFELADFRGVIEALNASEPAVSLDPKSANLLAVAYSKSGSYRQAYGILIAQLDQPASDLSTYLNLVTVCAEGGDLVKAGEIASRTALLFPKSPDVLVVRGAAASLLGHPDQASKDFAAASALAPDRADARFFLALMSYNSAKYPDALNLLRQSAQAGVEDSDLHYLAAECLLKVDTKTPDPAFAELNEAIQLNPDSVAARTLRGRLLLEKDQPHAAVTDLETAHRLDPGSRSATYQLARTYRRLGRNEQSAQLFKQLRSPSPDIIKEMSDRRLNETLADKGTQP